MQIIIHRGTHQIGGVATEIRTATTRIFIDMGDELGTDTDFIPKPLSIPGVTDTDGFCDAVLFTHNHGDHIGQLKSIRKDVPLYIGPLAKDIYLVTIGEKDSNLSRRVADANCFAPGQIFTIGNITITPFSVDHSACDSYMFLLEADGKRVLHMGDFRTHGLRGKGLPKLLDKLVGEVDVLITEGTTLSRDNAKPMTERELQKKAVDYMEQYKYVFVLAASTNLERIYALSRAVPQGKYFICDEHQKHLLELLEQHWGKYAPLYRNIKKTVYGSNKLADFRDKGFLMMVRDNRQFRKIISGFDAGKSIILYSMWDGYRTQPNSTIPAFLNLVGRWEPLHTSGHASPDDIRMVIEKANPKAVVPIHTDNPTALQSICPGRCIALLTDGEVYQI